MKTTLQRLHVVFLLLALLAWPTSAAETSIEVPVVEGSWWQIAPNAPDVGDWATGKENACDFTVFQANDGDWRCIACIRGTSHFGQRLFYQWRSNQLTAENWTPEGILDVPRGKRGKPLEFTSVQAPHHLVHQTRHYLFYNSATARCMISDDGVVWRPHVNVEGSQEFFPMGRDVCVFRDEPHDRWIAYYCGTATIGGERRGAMVARTAPTPEGPWSATEIPVKTDGNPESPFVIQRGDRYYLWQQMSVYVSSDPLDFDGAQLVAHMTGIWYNGKWAPEVFESEGQWHLAGYGRGIHVTRMKWVTKTHEEVAQWRSGWLRYLAEEERQRRERESRE